MSGAGVDRREGQVLAGKYQLHARLGVGGMGEVYRATNLLLGRSVAIKLLKRELAEKPEVVERFLREARAASLVRHPHVVDVLDVAEDDEGVPFIVQEFLEGADLADAMNDHGGRLPAHQVLQLMLPVIEAIGNAHAKGVVHRDLKPENVFLANTEAGVVAKVLDFGISKVMTDDQEIRLTATGAAMGTPAYMSPEQIRATKHVDARTDVWALGVILHEVLSGRLPYESETHGDLFVKICTEKPASLLDHAPDVAAEFSMVIGKCLQMAPEQRYASALELARDLQSLVTRHGKGPAFKHLASRSRPTPTPSKAGLLTPPGPSRTPQQLRKTPQLGTAPDVRETPAPLAPRTGQHPRVMSPPTGSNSSPGFDPALSGSIARRIYRGDIELTAEAISGPPSAPGAPQKISPDASVQLGVPVPGRQRRKSRGMQVAGGGAAAGELTFETPDDSGGLLMDIMSFVVLAVGLLIGAVMALHTDVYTTPGVVVGKVFMSVPTPARWVLASAVILSGLGLAQRASHTKPPRWGFLVAGGGVVLFGVCAIMITIAQGWASLAAGGRPPGTPVVLFPWGLALLPIGLGASLLYAAWERWRYGEGAKIIAAVMAALSAIAIVGGLWIAGVSARRNALLLHQQISSDPYLNEVVRGGVHETEPPPDPGVTMAPPRLDPVRPTPSAVTTATPEPEPTATAAPRGRHHSGRHHTSAHH